MAFPDDAGRWEQGTYDHRRVELHELKPGLWRWTAFHEEWKEAVGSVAYEAEDALVLVDPLLDDGAEVDELVGRVGKPVVALVSLYYHTRSAAEAARRYDGRVLAPARGLAAVRRRAKIAEPFRLDEELPGGVQALPTARSSEVVFWIPAHRALVPGDVLLGDDGGGVRLCPASWLPEGKTLADLAASLRPALELPVARVLVSHGDPVLRGGRAALERALAAAG
jgi:glyoxylase-like metal-dependent hydrolase (beta-lactamase superfamily II)